MAVKRGPKLQKDIDRLSKGTIKPTNSLVKKAVKKKVAKKKKAKRTY